MRPIRRVRRLLGSVILATTIAGLTAPAAMAGATIHHVGPGGGSGPCASPAFAGIQAAVNAAAPGDTILVCPGTYAQRLVVGTPDLTIRAVTRWTAIIRPPATAPSPLVLVADAADGTTLQWLKVVARTSGAGCSPHDGIRVDATGVAIVANRVVASTAGNTRNGPCTLVNGIHLAPGAEGVIRNNLVRDFSAQGIWTQQAVGAVIRDNSVRYWHPILTCAACVASPAAAPATTGINIFAGPATVSGNAVSSTDGAQTVDQLVNGIRIASSAGVVVRDNLVRRVTQGIFLDDTDDSRVRGNAVEGASFGVTVGTGSARNLVRANTVSSIISFGIHMNSGADNRFVANDASQAAAAADCRDFTSGQGNTWEPGNLGVTSDPIGLCSAP